jgi:hypothetical protein
MVWGGWDRRAYSPVSVASAHVEFTVADPPQDSDAEWSMPSSHSDQEKDALVGTVRWQLQYSTLSAHLACGGCGPGGFGGGACFLRGPVGLHLFALAPCLPLLVSAALPVDMWISVLGLLRTFGSFRAGRGKACSSARGNQRQPANSDL